MRGIFNNETFAPVDLAQRRAVDPTLLAVYGAQHSRLFYVTARLANNDSVARAERARRWLDSHYCPVDQIVTHTVTIRLYQTVSCVSK